mgnify:CR=1 FL=1
MPEAIVVLFCMFGFYALFWCLSELVSIPYVQKDDDDEQIKFLHEYNEKKKGRTKNEKRVQDSVK